MIKALKKLGTYLLVLVVGTQGVSAQADKAEKELKQIIKKSEIAGLSVAVVKNNEIIYTNAFGYKSLETKEPLQTTDIFRIASISKSFSATSIMQLVEAKKLNLSDDVSTLLGFKIRNPHFPNTPITLKMLLSHTSSINDSGGYFTFDAIDPAKNNGDTKCYSDYAPGTQYKYSNLNYNLIGAIIEKASGLRFDEYVRQNILNPLGVYAGYNVDSLDHDKFVSLYTYSKKNKNFTLATRAYEPVREVWDNYQLGYSAYSFSPTGGMKISAPDLAKVMMMHMNKGTYKGVKIISGNSAEQMQSHVADMGNGNYYGFGITNRKSQKLAEGNLLIGHGGKAHGLLSSMYFNPDDKYGFVVISSASNRGGVTDDIMEVLYWNFIK